MYYNMQVSVNRKKSASIVDGVKDGVWFAIIADYQVYVQIRFILTNLAKHVAIHRQVLCDVIS